MYMFEMQAWAEGLVPELAWIIPICVALSTFGHAHASLFAGGRSVFGYLN